MKKYTEKDKLGLSSIQFPSQETIAERLKLRRKKVDDKDLSDMPLLEGDEQEVKEEQNWKSNFQTNYELDFQYYYQKIKAGNNSYILKNEIRQIRSFLYQHNKITNKE